ncbi:SH3 domain-containing protein [Trichonephila inaurata madagascariensis]|uniref:SH3 domain-containing protein n=1 Tax=Trichonephila inaurata madagascariensis TaxID=2747483 RepID=A0A8X6YNB7_9ARAC|nr:SH3 domain-containing protein [Trichonephila inaurata madagascariensis]
MLLLINYEKKIEIHLASCASDVNKIEKILALFEFDDTNSKNDASTAIIPEDLSHEDEVPIVSDALTSDGSNPSASGKVTESLPQSSFEEYQVRAIKKYSARTAAELSFEEGDIIDIIDDGYATSTVRTLCDFELY